MDKYQWDERYTGTGYAYGKQPNDFLTGVANKIRPGKALCLGEGEGRNAIYLAGLGFDVTAVDYSVNGLRKINQLAGENGVTVKTVEADLQTFNPAVNSWDVIISIFFHLPSLQRRQLHHRCTSWLKSGGVFILEAYTPDQLNYNTGGPKSPDYLAFMTDLLSELPGIEFTIARETVREIHEGEFHDGPGAVVQLFGYKKPQV